MRATERAAVAPLARRREAASSRDAIAASIANSGERHPSGLVRRADISLHELFGQRTTALQIHGVSLVAVICIHPGHGHNRSLYSAKKVRNSAIYGRDESVISRRDGILRSEPFEVSPSGSRKTARSGALRGGLIEGHTVAGITRIPIVGRSNARPTKTAATTRQGRSAAPFFRVDERARGARCRPSARASPRSLLQYLSRQIGPGIRRYGRDGP